MEYGGVDRDADGECVCTKDGECSAPLGAALDGRDSNPGMAILRCFYHGWGFGKEGKPRSLLVSTRV